VKVIQHMVDTVWPGSSYKVKKGCPIYATRHLIGASTLKIVDIFFTSPKYAEQPNKIKKYAIWAIQADGPGWYEVPAPRNQVSIKGLPGYVGPTGLFRSPFFLEPLAAYVKSTTKSAGTWG
ncbi:hypothetical protein GGX14DRAFT_334795, partial [Mycena pura]